MRQDIRVAVLGTGYIAQTVAAAIARVPGMSVAGFASRTPGRAAALASGWPGARDYRDLADMLADPAVGAIYIAHETAGHAAAAQAALEAGRPVLCEKPCAIDGAEVRAIADTAARTGTLFMEAIATPFLPAVAAALEAARSGTLGQLRQMSASFGYLATRETHPGCYAAAGGGVLLDRMVYLVTLARLALGPVQDVQAALVRDADGIDVHAALLLRHADGATASLQASFVAELDNRLAIAGSGGTAVVGAPLLSAETLLVRGASPARAASPPGGLGGRLRAVGAMRRAADLARARHNRRLSFGASPYAHELAHFRDMVRAGASASPVLPPSLSAEVMDVLDRARTQAA